jgi:hypothetical protein
MTDAKQMFNKSFNDLTFLQSTFNTKYNYAFVFDFDLTLTLKSSDGIDYNKNFIELFESEYKLDKLNILSEIQTTAGEHDLDTYAAALLYHSTKYSV